MFLYAHQQYMVLNRWHDAGRDVSPLVSIRLSAVHGSEPGQANLIKDPVFGFLSAYQRYMVLNPFIESIVEDVYLGFLSAYQRYMVLNP